MVIVALTWQEVAKHQKAIARVRAQLFHRHSLADYSIVHGTEVVIAAHAQIRVRLATREQYRVLTLGGLTYEFRVAEIGVRWWFTVTHSAGSRFFIFVNWNARGDSNAQFTRYAMDADFSAIDSTVYRAVQQVQLDAAMTRTTCVELPSYRRSGAQGQTINS